MTILFGTVRQPENMIDCGSYSDGSRHEYVVVSKPDSHNLYESLALQDYPPPVSFGRP